ncbi:hypothetical protein MVG78_06635 [Roseomonas gilardii subsp. gilardii]|uniref:hypothetical protein n=1 Tax=Roseomonas gilardii TaxID=257708 RepID=UPI001FFA3C2F|nr:hypothetical protein [Roseomonas gilardii]UPG73810.1 hypothetical protein MVG78_06635 [Roseomonas gilardii subsp. gilardii]
MSAVLPEAAVKVAEPEIAATDAHVARGPGLFRRLLRDPVGAAALVLVVVLVAAAVLAPWLSPTDPYDNDLSLAMQPPGLRPASGWGRMRRGATWSRACSSGCGPAC